MERFRARGIVSRTLLAIVSVMVLLPSTGCHSLLATSAFLWEGGNMVPAECAALNGKRVVVLCRPPSSQEYRHAGASRDLAARISRILVQNVDGIDVVNPREVDNWIDESDLRDFRDLGKAVKADLVLHVEIDNFDLFKGKTLYQGNADVTLSVYDMNDDGQLMWDKPLGEILFPTNSGIPIQDKSEQQFQREFVTVLADRIARHFYQHDAHVDFAMDALANR